jgi:hypothetical protein
MNTLSIYIVNLNLIGNVCIPNPCRNNGICIQSGSTTAYCICDNNWSGYECEMPNPCISNPCKNYGICTPFWGSLNYVQYKCNCPFGYTGINCEFNNNICSPATCSNGGTCFLNPDTNTAKCLCSFLYTGEFCELSFNPCMDTNTPKCFNNGECLLNPTEYPFYRCLCSSGFYGFNCQLTSTTSSPSRCEDKSFACSIYAVRQYCQNYYFLNGVSVLTYCPKSCKVCTGLAITSTSSSDTSSCVDAQASCAIWGALKYCNQLPDPFVCRKSCNLC